MTTLDDSITRYQNAEALMQENATLRARLQAATYEIFTRAIEIVYEQQFEPKQTIINIADVLVRERAAALAPAPEAPGAKDTK